MSKDIRLHKKRAMTFNESHEEAKRPSASNAEKFKKKIFQKSLGRSKTMKKYSPNKSKNDGWNVRRMKKAFVKSRLPTTPHNTTQFIVDAVYCPTDPYIYDFQSNPLKHSFENHAMAGSMMEMMQRKLDNHENTGKEMIVEHENVNHETDSDVPELRSVRSADDVAIIDNRNYDQFLKDAESGKNLKDVIKQLVQVIRGKDDQINLLLSEKDK